MKDTYRLVLSGASGYLASSFLEYLCVQHEQFFSDFFLLDKDFSEKDFSPKTYKLFSELSAFYKIDLLRPFDLEDLLNKLKKTENIKQVFMHTAHLKNLESEKKLISSISENFPDTYFIYFSSAAVYGESEDKKARSVSDRCKPISDYGRYKLELEKLVAKSFSKHLILRIANPYGKEKSTKGVWKIFQTKILEQIEAQKKSKHIKIKLEINAESPGQIVRDFIYVDDLCANLYKFIKLESLGILHLSSGSGQSLEEMSKKILLEIIQDKALNQDRLALSFVYRGLKEGDIKFSILY
jgi:nucleoside-diphosphate-sugar epimerase